MFKKGQSGNPGGRPKQDIHLRDLARAKTEEAIKTLVEIMRNKKAPSAARVTAACALLDRGYGKPTQTTELTGVNGAPIEIQETSDMEIARRYAFLLAQAAIQKAREPA